MHLYSDHKSEFETEVDSLTASATRKQFPDIRENDETVRYAATLIDGRVIWLKWPSARTYIDCGIVQIYGGVKLKNGLVSAISIRADSDGDNLTFETMLRYQVQMAEDLSLEAREKIIKEAEFENMSEADERMLIGGVGNMIDDFLKSIKPIVEFRNKTSRNIKESILAG